MEVASNILRGSGVKHAELFGGDRIPCVSNVRQKIIRALYQEGHKPVKIANFLKCDHSTVYYHVKDGTKEIRRIRGRNKNRKTIKVDCDGLTETQRKVFDFVKTYISEHSGISPTQHEIMLGCGFKHDGIVSRAVKSMVLRGHMERTYGQRRSIRPKQSKYLDFLGRHRDAFMAQCESEGVKPETVLRDLVANYMGDWA